jgi:hypothetical protein
MSNLFALNTIKKVAGISKSRYIEPRFEPEIADCFLKYDNAADLATAIGNPSKGSRFYCIINGNFIFGDFIEALIVENEWQVEDLTISTLSMSDENVDSLAGLLNGGHVAQLNLIVSDFFFSHERGGMVPYLYEKLDIEDRFQLAVASVHTKICLIQTIGGNKIVIHGSANLRTSSNVEQIMIENNDDLYDFNAEIHNAIIDRYKTINKSLRRTELWRAVLESNGEKQTDSALRNAINTGARQKPSNVRKDGKTKPTSSVSAAAKGQMSHSENT